MFIKNTVTSIFGTGLNVFVQGTYFLLLTRILRPKEYGAYVAVLALSRIIGSFASWGYGNILIMNTARDNKRFRTYWGGALLITLVGGVVLISFVLVLSIFVLRLKIPITAIILISASEIMFGTMQVVCQQAYQAFEKMARYVQLQIGASLVKLVVVIIMFILVREPTVLSWSRYYFIASMIAPLIGIALVNKELGRYVFGMKIIKGEFREGLYFSASQATQTIDNDIDKSILASMTSFQTTGLYSAAYKIIDFAYVPISGLLISAYANYFKHGSNGIKGGIRWAKTLVPWAGLYGLITSVIVFAASGMAVLILGPAYSETAIILKWLSPIILFRSIQNLIADILTGSGYQRIRMAIHIGVALVNICLLVSLIPNYGWRGAAVASIVSDGLAVILFAGSVLIGSRQLLFNKVSHQPGNGSAQ